jgi:hypothetical protein
VFISIRPTKPAVSAPMRVIPTSAITSPTPGTSNGRYSLGHHSRGRSGCTRASIQSTIASTSQTVSPIGAVASSPAMNQRRRRPKTPPRFRFFRASSPWLMLTLPYPVSASGISDRCA